MGKSSRCLAKRSLTKKAINSDTQTIHITVVGEMPTITPKYARGMGSVSRILMVMVYHLILPDDWMADMIPDDA